MQYNWIKDFILCYFGCSWVVKMRDTSKTAVFEQVVEPHTVLFKILASEVWNNIYSHLELNVQIH